MYKDAEEELKRLEEALLEEEEQPEEMPEEDGQEEDLQELLEEAQRIAGLSDDSTQVYRWQEPLQDQTARVYNTDKTDEDLEEFSRAVQEEPQKGITGLAITAITLAIAVLGVLIWWMIRYRGVLG